MMRMARVLVVVLLGGALAVAPWEPAAAQGGLGRSENAQRGRQVGSVDVQDEMQPDTLPTLPPGMTLADIRAGDAVYHGKGHCFVCHGAEGQGEPAAGDAISVALAYAQYDWRSIDSLVAAGIPDALTRSPIRMPPRGGKSDLTPAEMRRVAAYVWAISQTHGEPWAGGHASHATLVPLGAMFGTATARPPHR